MNLRKVIVLIIALLILAFSLAGCEIKIYIEGLLNPTPKDWDELYDIITIEEAIQICESSEMMTTEKYYIRGFITDISDFSRGSMTIKDETGKIYVSTLSENETMLPFDKMENAPSVDDEILIYCRLEKVDGIHTAKVAVLIDVKKANYPELSIDDAREIEVGEKIKVSGTVARMTYAFGMVPSGFYLVDGTNSIYVYGKDIAAQVSEGNNITVLASKTYWVLEDEQNSADKFGYKGCCQLENATLLANDGKKNDIDLSWCEEKSVKEIMETPVTENITTTIYKTTALVKKAEGTGFVNYYIDDLDGATGSYAYTQCSGSDFAWLDEFDGKICTVYLSVINAKSSSSGCIWRFIPVAVVDENFSFDLAKAPEHVLEYYGMGKILGEYAGDPHLELVTSVSSELLGFENATLSYTSNNTDLVYFEEIDGKTVMHCKGEGKTTVTITASYNGISVSESVEVSVVKPVEIPSINVSQAIDSEVGETVTVKGIVGPSLVNKSGFYLIDESGVIAILVNETSEFDGLSIGNEVILQGKRDKFNSGNNGHGVTCITSATIIENHQGKHDYSTATFITDKTLADFYALDENEDHTTEVYVLKATINWVKTDFYTKVDISNGGTNVSLYCSGAGQYSFLSQFAGQEVTIEIAPCNWNGKSYYAGCVLSVITEDGKVYNELNFTTGK